MPNRKKWYLLLFFILLGLLLAANGLTSFPGRQRDFLLKQVVSVKNIPQHSKEIRIWVPYPAQNPHQKVKDLTGRQALPYKISYDKVYGNKMLYYVINSPQLPAVSIEREFRISRYEFINRPYGSGRVSFPMRIAAMPPELTKYTGEDGFIIITDEIRQLAKKITGKKEADIEKAAAIYDYVFENVSYDKSEPGWGTGDIKRVCLVRKGNCTDFHSLFISLCRACGIPARFIMGVSLNERGAGITKNYHCWAEFYALGYGWVPVDISEAWKNKAKRGYFLGAVDENRVEFTRGRDIVLEPPQNGSSLNYFIFPYVEIDGEFYRDNVEASFIFEDAQKKGG